MYVCLCKGITDQDIIQELDQGARNLKDLNKRLGVGSQCGSCCAATKELINDYRHTADNFSLAYQAA